MAKKALKAKKVLKQKAAASKSHIQKIEGVELLRFAPFFYDYHNFEFTFANAKAKS